jgi:uncharacterized tellurite resistance protein B-like protein
LSGKVELTTSHLDDADDIEETDISRERRRQGVFTKELAWTMLGSIKTFFADLVGNIRPRTQTDGYNSYLATAALLRRVATVHSEMSEARRKRLYTVLKSSFGLDDHTTAQLIEESIAVDRNAIDLYQYTRQLNEVLDEEGRRLAVQMMWEIVYADRNANEFEANIIWRAADLLGVSSRQRVALRQRVSADRATVARVGAGRPQPPALETTNGN